MSVHELLIGDSVEMLVTVTSQDGNPDDPTGVVLLVQLPGGVDVLQSPDDVEVELNTDNGTAACIFKPSAIGVHAFRWFFPGFPGGAVEGIFRVRPSVIV